MTLDLEFEQQYKELVKEVGEPVNLSAEEYEQRKSELFNIAKSELLKGKLVKRDVLNRLGKLLFKIGTKPIESIPKLIVKELVDDDGKPMAHPDYIRRSLPEMMKAKDTDKDKGQVKKKSSLDKKESESERKPSTIAAGRKSGLQPTNQKEEPTQKTSSTSIKEPSKSTTQTETNQNQNPSPNPVVQVERKTKRKSTYANNNIQPIIGTEIEEIVLDIPELVSATPKVDADVFHKVNEQLETSKMEISKLNNELQQSSDQYQKLFLEFETTLKKLTESQKTIDDFKMGFASLARPWRVRKWIDWKNKAGILQAILGLTVEVNPAKKSVGRLSDVAAFSSRDEVDRDRENWAHQTQGKYYLEV